MAFCLNAYTNGADSTDDEFRSVFNEFGGNLVEDESVSSLFVSTCAFTIPVNEGFDTDAFIDELNTKFEVFDSITDAQDEENSIVTEISIWVHPDEANEVSTYLKNKGFDFETEYDADILFNDDISKLKELDEKDYADIMKMYERLYEIDDVSAIGTNALKNRTNTHKYCP